VAEIKAGQIWEKGGGRCEVSHVNGRCLIYTWDGPAKCMPPVGPWNEDGLRAFRRWAATARLVKEG